MKELLPLRNIARIGTHILVMLSGITPNEKIELDAEERDYSKCPLNCSFFHFEKKNKMFVCENFCPHHIPKRKRAVYINEGHQYKIPKNLQRNFSKTAIKFYILLHFLPVEKEGFIRFISLSKMAQMLNVTTRTVKNTISLFQELGLLCATNISSDYVHFFLTDYHLYHLPYEKGGKGGYINLPKSYLLELLKMDHVASIRFSLRNYKETMIAKDTQNIGCNEWTKQEIKKFLPKHLHYETGIKKTIEGIKHTFDVTYNGHFAFIYLKEQYDGTAIEKNLKAEAHLCIMKFAKEMHIHFKQKAIDDLIQLSLEYNISSVLKVMEEISQNNPILLSMENIGIHIRKGLRMLQKQKILAS